MAMQQMQDWEFRVTAAHLEAGSAQEGAQELHQVRVHSMAQAALLHGPPRALIRTWRRQGALKPQNRWQLFSPWPHTF